MRHRDLDDERLEDFTGRGNPPGVGQIDVNLPLGVPSRETSWSAPSGRMRGRGRGCEPSGVERHDPDRRFGTGWGSPNSMRRSSGWERARP
jgi:hypothetical protein